MQRVFHAKIQPQSWLLVAAMLGVAVYFMWNRQPVLIAASLLLIVLIVERMTHTCYTVADGNLVIHAGRFARDRTIPIADIETIERIHGLRVFGKSLHSFLLIRHSGGRQTAVVPQNDEDFVRTIEKHRKQ